MSNAIYPKGVRFLRK